MSDTVLRASLAVLTTTGLLGAAILLAPRLSAGRGAETRHAIWSATLLLLLLVPLVAFTTPVWRASLFGIVAPDPSSVASTIVTQMMPPPGALPALGDRGPGQVTMPATKLPARAPLQLGSLLLMVWGVGALAVLGRVTTDVLRLVRLSRSSAGIPSPLRQEVRAEALRLGLARVPRVRRANVRSPLTWGIRGEVLLPIGAERWTPAERRIVLLHELGHLQRRDAIWVLVAQLACVIHWFNPLAWLVSVRLRHDAELLTDALVVACGVARSEYAEGLVRLAASIGDPAPALSLTVVDGPAGLEGRLRALLLPMPPGKRSWWHPVGWALAAIAAITPLLAVRPAAPAAERAIEVTREAVQLDHEPLASALTSAPASEPLWTGEVGSALRVWTRLGTVVARTSPDGVARVRGRWADGGEAPLHLVPSWDEGRRVIGVTDAAGKEVTGAVVLVVDLPSGVPILAWAGRGTVDVDVASPVAAGTVTGDVTVRTSETASIWTTRGDITARVGRTSGEDLRIVTQRGSIDLWYPGVATVTKLSDDAPLAPLYGRTGEAKRVGDVALQAWIGTITLHPER